MKKNFLGFVDFRAAENRILEEIIEVIVESVWNIKLAISTWSEIFIGFSLARLLKRTKQF